MMLYDETNKIEAILTKIENEKIANSQK